MARKEVNIGERTIKLLGLYAAAENRSLKNYMERVLIAHANKLEDRQKVFEAKLKSQSLGGNTKTKVKP